MIYYVNENILNIGTINFNSILNEESIDKKNPNFGFGECEVFIYKLEGKNIPHIHIKNDRIDTCICIYKNYYFLHGNSHVDTMNNKECKELDDWLRKENKRSRYKNYTNWEVACILWEENFSSPKDKVYEQPDYTKLNENGAI